MTNEERKALVERLRHTVCHGSLGCERLGVDDQAANQIEADGQRIAELEREKAVVSDLLEQQKELALEYLFDCNRSGERIAELEAALRGIVEFGERHSGHGFSCARLARAALGEGK